MKTKHPVVFDFNGETALQFEETRNALASGADFKGGIRDTVRAGSTDDVERAKEIFRGSGCAGHRHQRITH